LFVGLTVVYKRAEWLNPARPASLIGTHIDCRSTGAHTNICSHKKGPPWGVLGASLEHPSKKPPRG
jgi:hypothetical protein